MGIVVIVVLVIIVVLLQPAHAVIANSEALCVVCFGTMNLVVALFWLLLLLRMVIVAETVLAHVLEPPVFALVIIRLMIEFLHYLKDPKLWELWYIPYFG